MWNVKYIYTKSQSKHHFADVINLKTELCSFRRFQTMIPDWQISSVLLTCFFLSLCLFFSVCCGGNSGWCCGNLLYPHEQQQHVEYYIVISPKQTHWLQQIIGKYTYAPSIWVQNNRWWWQKEGSVSCLIGAYGWTMGRKIVRKSFDSLYCLVCLICFRPILSTLFKRACMLIDFRVLWKY